PTAQCSSAPPVNKLYMPNREEPLAACRSKKSARALPFKPGMRTTASSRQMARTIRVNKIRDLSSGILKQLLKVLAMAESIFRWEIGDRGSVQCSVRAWEVGEFLRPQFRRRRLWLRFWNGRRR